MNFKRFLYTLLLLTPLFFFSEVQMAVAQNAEPQTKQFDKQKIEQLEDSGDFEYVEAKPKTTSLLQRFLNFLNNLINKFFAAAADTLLGRVLLYIALFVLLMVALVKIFSLNVNEVFRGSTDKGSLGFEMLDEDIEKLDLEQLLKSALDKNDYRLAVRVVYLKALRSLNEAQLVTWESGKTNHDYLQELRSEHLRKPFDSLCYYFDYAWYGEFEVNKETYEKAVSQATFIQSNIQPKKEGLNA